MKHALLNNTIMNQSMIAKHPLLTAVLFTLSTTTASAATTDTSIAINFAAEVAGKPFNCGEQYDNLGSAKTTASLADFRVFISEVSLINADGESVPAALVADDTWQTENVALLDFENGTDSCDNGTPETNTQIIVNAPEGDYKGVELTIGVPFESNHGDPTLQSSPLNLTALFWNWRGGYRFMKLDFLPQQDDQTLKGWSLHVGSTGCMSDSKTRPPQMCKTANRIALRFEQFDIANDVLVIDPAKVIAEADITQNMPETSPGCMSFPHDTDCATVFPKLGLDYMDSTANEQLLVSIKSK